MAHLWSRVLPSWKAWSAEMHLIFSLEMIAQQLAVQT